MTNAPAILSVLAEKPRHHDLLGLHSVGGVPVIDVPIDALGRADLAVTCQDGAMLGIVYLDLVGLFHALRTNELMSRLVSARQRWPWTYLVLGAVLSPSADGRHARNARGEGSGWAWDAVQGALLSAQEIGVGVIQIPHVDLLAAQLERLAKRDRSPVRVRPPRDSLFYEPGQDLLMALPGIGEGKADALLAFCDGRADLALMCLTSDIAKAPGIGPETKKAARRALGCPDGYALLATRESDLPLNEQADILQISTYDATEGEAARRLEQAT